MVIVGLLRAGLGCFAASKQGGVDSRSAVSVGHGAYAETASPAEACIVASTMTLVRRLHAATRACCTSPSG